MPLTLGMLLALALAAGCLRVALRREGPRSIAATVAAGGLALVPFGSVVVMSADVGSGNLVCGSALSSSLSRGLPDDGAFTEDQAYCKDRGVATVRRAATATGTAVVAAAVLVTYASLPPRPRPALA